NCMVLTEGFDEPSVECVVIARPTKSKPLYLQMIGRGSRLSPGKKECLILDVTGVSKQHSLVTVPVLFGTKGEESIKEKDEREKKVRQKRNQELIQLQKVFSGEEHRKFSSQIEWLKAHDDLYILDCGDIGQLRLRREDGDQWGVNIKKRGEHREQFLSPDPFPLDLAQGIGEDYIRRINPKIIRLIGKDARWKKSPASPAQISLLEKHGVDFDPNAITKGEAARTISLLFVK